MSQKFGSSKEVLPALAMSLTLSVYIVAIGNGGATLIEEFRDGL